MRGIGRPLARCIGDGYVWIDHATGVAARTAEEL
jgi:hypothetical protein